MEMHINLQLITTINIIAHYRCIDNHNLLSMYKPTSGSFMMLSADIFCFLQKICGHSVCKKTNQQHIVKHECNWMCCDVICWCILLSSKMSLKCYLMCSTFVKKCKNVVLPTYYAFSAMSFSCPSHPHIGRFRISHVHQVISNIFIVHEVSWNINRNRRSANCFYWTRFQPTCPRFPRHHRGANEMENLFALRIVVHWCSFWTSLPCMFRHKIYQDAHIIHKISCLSFKKNEWNV